MNFNAIIDSEKEKSNNTIKGDLIKQAFVLYNGVSYKIKLEKVFSYDE